MRFIAATMPLMALLLYSCGPEQQPSPTQRPQAG